MNARGIPSVQYTQINQLEGLRRMQHNREGKIRIGGGMVNIVINPAPDPTVLLANKIAANPCSFFGHRPAWLNNGGIACGVCGAYL